MTKPPVYFLLVDDLEENLMSLEALLRRDGLRILKAHSGPEALELLLTHEVALALLDVQMPGMDGFALAELMRSTERTSTIPIIFLTAGAADQQRRFRGYEAGAVDFLQKPIETDILRSKADIFFRLHCQHIELKAVAEENARLLNESQKYAKTLKDTDRRKDEFLATLAHELRNPLAAVSNGLQILRMSPQAETGEKVRDMMYRQLTHLVRLIDDLLDVSRITQGKIDLRKENIVIQTVIQAAVESSQPSISASRHEFVLHVPEEPLWLNGDLTRLAQILSNLLNNAAKYTPEGGTITLSVEQLEKDVLIKVADNGLGIPAAMLPKIFELFTQVDRTLERAQGGLGIGLALVKEMVDLHGGSIMAESPGLGKGSTFTVRLPLALSQSNYAGSAEAGQLAATTATPLKVLVVDDNLPSAKTIGWMLELIGHETMLVHDGIQALAAAKEFLPAVVVLDIGLPGMNGYDVCRTLRSDPLFKNTVIIAQTGWGQDRDRLEARKAGFDHHLTKPVNFEEFSALLAGIQDSRAA